MEFVQRLKECRKSKKLTQKEVANFLEIGERSYQHYEYGEREPTFATVIKLADYFNVSLDYLAGRSNFKSVITEDEEGNIVTVNSDNPEINK